MKNIITMTLLCTTLLLASNSKKKDNMVENQIKQQMDREKKYAKERKFYSNKNYDFKAAEVNPDSLDSLPDLEDDDMDMDDVYD